MTVVNFEPIEKEKIETLRFPSIEVLVDKEKIAERDANLKRALTLGNLEHSKIKIYFEDDTTMRMVETTIWGLTDKRIILKHGLVIPIQRVHAVQI